MTPELSQSLIDEFNLVKVENNSDNLPTYGFREFAPESGYLLWLECGAYKMARYIALNTDDTHYWLTYCDTITLSNENEVRNQLYHLRASIKKRIKEGKEKIVRQKINKIEMDFV